MCFYVYIQDATTRQRGYKQPNVYLFIIYRFKYEQQETVVQIWRIYSKTFENASTSQDK